MSNTATQEREFKIGKGYSNDKEYSFHELLGMFKVFSSLRSLNPKLKAKVDYWINKNEKVLGEQWKLYLADEKKLIQGNVKQLEKDGVTYTSYVGKDADDIIYYDHDKNTFFKLIDGKLKEVELPYWEKEVPAAEEGGEPTIEKMRYELNYGGEEEKAAFEKLIGDLQADYKFTFSLWPLSEEHLEGLNVMWQKFSKEGQLIDDITQYRNLLYDNAIV